VNTPTLFTRVLKFNHSNLFAIPHGLGRILNSARPLRGALDLLDDALELLSPIDVNLIRRADGAGERSISDLGGVN